MKELLCREENVLLWNLCDQWLSISLIDSHWRRFERHCHHITCQRNYIHANELLCWNVGGVSSLCWDQCRYSKQSLYRRHQCDLCLRSEHKHFKATETWTGRAGAAAWLLIMCNLLHFSSIITRVDKSRSTNTTVRKHCSESWSAEV